MESQTFKINCDHPNAAQIKFTVFKKSFNNHNVYDMTVCGLNNNQQFVVSSANHEILRYMLQFFDKPNF